MHHDMGSLGVAIAPIGNDGESFTGVREGRDGDVAEVFCH